MKDVKGSGESLFTCTIRQLDDSETSIDVTVMICFLLDSRT